MWLYFPAKNLSHSEGTWLCDCIPQNEINIILRGPGYVFILSSQKPIPFWAELTRWLYFQAKNLSHSEGSWLCDHIFQHKIYPIHRRPDHVIVSLGMKSNPFWGDLTMFLYFPAKNLSHSEGTWHVIDSLGWNLTHSEGTWLCDCTFSQKTIPFWEDLSMWS